MENEQQVGEYIIPYKTTETILNSVKFGNFGLRSSNNDMAKIHNFLSLSLVKLKQSIRNSVISKVGNCLQETELYAK